MKPFYSDLRAFIPNGRGEWLASLKQGSEPWTSRPASRPADCPRSQCFYLITLISWPWQLSTRCISWGGVRSRGSWESKESSVHHSTHPPDYSRSSIKKAPQVNTVRERPSCSLSTHYQHCIKNRGRALCSSWYTHTPIKKERKIDR